MADNRYNFVITAQNQEFLKAFDQARAKAEAEAKALPPLFTAAAAGIAAAFVGDKLLAGLETFKKFDDARKQIQAFSGASADDLELIKQKALELGPAFGRMPTDVVAGMSEMIQSGMSVTEVMSKVEAVLALSAGTGKDMATSADTITDTMNAMNIEGSKTADTVDVMVKAIADGSLSADEYYETLKKAAPVVGSYGVSLRELSAEIMAVAENGIKGELAATGLTNSYARLIKPTGEGKAALDAIGFSAYDNSGKLKTLATMIDELGAASLNEADRIAIFGQEAGPVLAGLLQDGGKAITYYQAKLDGIGGFATKTGKTMESGIGGASRKVAAELEAGLLRTFDLFEPALVGIIGLMGNVGVAFDKVEGTLKTGAAAFNEFAAGAVYAATPLGYITDALGVTDNAVEEMAKTQETFSSSAGDLLGQAAIAYQGLSASAIESKKSQETAAAATSKKLKEVSAATGIALNSYQEFEDAVAKGVIVWDEASAAYISTETGKGAEINKTTEAIKSQVQEAGSAATQFKSYADALKDFSGSTGFSGGSENAKADVEALQGKVEAWRQAGVQVETINSGLYTKISAMHSAALKQGDAETAAYLAQQLAQYEGYATDTAQVEKERADLVAETFRKTGAASAQYYANELKNIETYRASLEQSGMDRIDIETAVVAKIQELNDSLIQPRLDAEKQLYELTGQLTQGYLDTYAESLRSKVQAWADASGEIVDIEGVVQDQLVQLTDDANAKKNESIKQAWETARIGGEQYVEVEKQRLQKIADEWIASGQNRLEVERWLASEQQKIVSQVAAESASAIQSVPNEKNVAINGDASGVVTAAGEANSALNELDQAVASVQMTQYEYLKDLSTSSLLLNKMDTIDQVQEVEREIISSTEAMRQEVLSGGKKSVDELASYEQESYEQVIEAKKHGSRSAVQEAEGEMKKAIKERLDAEKEAAEEEKKLAKEAAEARKEALQEEAEARRDMLGEQLDSAKEQLDLAKDMQKAYWDEQLDNAEEYYNKVKEQAQEEYDNAVELVNKKIALAEKELNAASEKMSALEKIYSDTGGQVGGDQYFKAKADDLAKEAQEMKKAGVDKVLIEKWLQDELNDLKADAAEKGIAGMDAYSQSIMTSYAKTGEFSIQTKKLEDQIESLKKKLQSMQEEGADAFFDAAAIKGGNFGGTVEAAKAKVDQVKESIAGLNGENFDLTGATADSMAAAVSVADQQVKNLEASLKSVEQELKNISKIDTDVQGSSDSSGSGGGGGGGGGNPWVKVGQTSQFDGDGNRLLKWKNTITGLIQTSVNQPSYSGGGYTGDGSRTGGIDGEGGFSATLHPKEYVLDTTKPLRDQMSITVVQPASSGSGDGGGDSVVNRNTYINIASVNLQAEKGYDLNRLKSDLKRMERRN